MSKIIIDNDGRLLIEDAKLMFRNFAGVEGEFNKLGDRNFCVIIDDPEISEEINERGWNVKVRKPKSDLDPIIHFVRVNVKYRRSNDGRRVQGPRVVMHTSKGARELDDQTIGLLDTADISKAHVVINPYHWQKGGQEGISGYLDSIHVEIREDYFSSYYKDEHTLDISEENDKGFY